MKAMFCHPSGKVKNPAAYGRTSFKEKAPANWSLQLAAGSFFPRTEATAHDKYSINEAKRQESVVGDYPNML
jgi:hypothetical protein